jgi:hypothetical protein
MKALVLTLVVTCIQPLLMLAWRFLREIHFFCNETPAAGG